MKLPEASWRLVLLGLSGEFESSDLLRVAAMLLWAGWNRPLLTKDVCLLSSDLDCVPHMMLCNIIHMMCTRLHYQVVECLEVAHSWQDGRIGHFASTYLRIGKSKTSATLFQVCGTSKSLC